MLPQHTEMRPYSVDVYLNVTGGGYALGWAAEALAALARLGGRVGRQAGSGLALRARKPRGLVGRNVLRMPGMATSALSASNLAGACASHA